MEHLKIKFIFIFDKNKFELPPLLKLLIDLVWSRIWCLFYDKNMLGLEAEAKTMNMLTNDGRGLSA